MFSSTNPYYDAAGQLVELASRFADAEAPDRTVKSEYDKYGRLAKVVYDDLRTEEYTRDTWGKILKVTATDGETTRESVMKYDYFDRLIEQIETVNGKLAASNKYDYNAYGQRTLRETQTPLGPQTETREYDQFGRLVLIESGSDKVEYQYNALNQVATRTANGIPVVYTYTAQGQLQSKTLGDGIATQEYFYSPSGRLIARADNGERVDYTYDAKGQLLAVVNATGETVESYTYDPAGNILEKLVDGVTTTFTYDAANQLVTSMKGDEVTNYAYDAAGRLVKSGATEYSYGWMDKVIGMTDGTTDKTMNYYINGQLASVNDLSNQTVENFVWDGLALIQRNAISYLNEPAVTGGNPILADGKALFEDHLGSSAGVYDGSDYQAIERTAFGEVKESNDFNFYTGKPEIEGLGYAFLFRNYQASNGKWQTTDPLGYPDGWNNLAYVNNGVTEAIDWLGAATWYLQAVSSDYSSTVTSSSWIDSTNTSIDGVIVGYTYARLNVTLSARFSTQILTQNLTLGIGALVTLETQYVSVGGSITPGGWSTDSRYTASVSKGMSWSIDSAGYITPNNTAMPNPLQATSPGGWISSTLVGLGGDTPKTYPVGGASYAVDLYAKAGYESSLISSLSIGAYGVGISFDIKNAEHEAGPLSKTMVFKAIQE